MELVYLWVEDYKNIHRQGFNFSPRFRCEYDPDTNELTIDENDDYVDIFPDNINVTAIVGKNGSGKSSLLEVLKFYNHQIETNYILIYKYQNNYYGYSSTVISSTINIIWYNIKKKSDNFINLISKYIVYNDLIEKDYLEYLNIKGEYTNYFKKNIYDKQNIFFFISKYIPLLNYFTEEILYINEFIYFDTIRLILRKRDAKKLDWILYPIGLNVSLQNKEQENNLFRENAKIIEEILQLLKSAQLHILQQYNIHPNNYQYSLNGMQERGILSLTILIGFIELILKDNSNLEANKLLLEIFKEKANLIKNNNAFITFSDIKDMILSFNQNLKEKSIRNSFKLDIYIDIINFVSTLRFIYDNKEDYFYCDLKIKEQKTEILTYISKLITFTTDNDENAIKSEDSLRIMEIDIYGNSIFYNKLSDGERQFNNLILDIFQEIYIAQKLNRKAILILGDEIDNSMHPIWKQKVISIIINVFKQFKDIKFYLLITTHSPFLLSDIPKQNIIFLDTYKKEDEEVKNGKQKVGNCKVVDGLNEKKETFGANIHTLLSDSFFMKDGLMGEFAKGKIEGIRKFYNRVIKYKDNDKVKKAYKCFYEKKQKEFWDIQSIIGEPFLQKIVKNQLEEIELILFGKNDAIDKEIARLQALKESFNND